MIQSSKADPDYPRVNHNISMMFYFKQDKANAEIYLKKEIAAVDDLNSRLELLQFYLKNNDKQKALNLAESILKLYPDTEDVKQVMQRLGEDSQREWFWLLTNLSLGK